MEEGEGNEGQPKEDKSSSSSTGSSTSTLHNIVASGIQHPGKNDVMFGRGGDTNYHIGNHRFRMQADKYRQSYREASRKEKTVIVQQLVDSWRAEDPPGRFLTRTDPSKGDDSLWHDVGTELALKKAAKILTERASSSEGKGRQKRQAADRGEEGVPVGRQRQFQQQQQQQFQYHPQQQQLQQMQQLQFQPQQQQPFQYQHQQAQQQLQLHYQQQQQLQLQQQQLQLQQQQPPGHQVPPFASFPSFQQYPAVASLPQPQFQVVANPTLSAEAQSVPADLLIPPVDIAGVALPRSGQAQLSESQQFAQDHSASAFQTGTPLQAPRPSGDLGMSFDGQSNPQAKSTEGSPPEDAHAQAQAQSSDDSPPVGSGDALPSAASLSGVFNSSNSNSGSGSSAKPNSDSSPSDGSK